MGDMHVMPMIPLRELQWGRHAYNAYDSPKGIAVERQVHAQKGPIITFTFCYMPGRKHMRKMKRE